tara:strand:- start:1169 stop:1381 length:213 start_codon:yes stop_codon:yes gene_type:complete
MKNNLKTINRDIREHLTEEQFDSRVRKLLHLGIVEIVDCDDDGSPIVKVTNKGLELFLSELSDQIPGDDE